MTLELLTPLLGFELSHDLKAGNYTIFHDRTLLSKVYLSEYVKSELGERLVNHFTWLPYVYEIDKSAPNKFSNNEWLTYSIERHIKTLTLTNFLWFAKDCSAHPVCFIIFPP